MGAGVAPETMARAVGFAPFFGTGRIVSRIVWTPSAGAFFDFNRTGSIAPAPQPGELLAIAPDDVIANEIGEAGAD